MAKVNAAARGTARGMIWLVVLAVALSISAYSLYFVARTLGVPKLFAVGFSTAYDGVALIAADKSLQFAQEGKSGTFPRLVMVLFAGLSAFLNSLHAIFGHESMLAIPMWAGLPLAAVAAFEIHTSQARAKAHARYGYSYPAPAPRYGGHAWMLFPLRTLNGVRDVIGARLTAVTTMNRQFTQLNARGARDLTAPDQHAQAARGERDTPEQPAARATAKAGPERPYAGTHAGDEHEAHDEANDAAASTVTTIRTCANTACARGFVPARKDARYCSGKCRAAASRSRREKEA